MSLGTIHTDLYKTIAKEGKINAQAKTNLRFSLFVLSFLVISSLAASVALATHAVDIHITDDTDRINRTGTSNTVVWQINVTNQPGSANTITMVNITNATGYVITNVNATGNSTQACTTLQLSVNCTGLNILAGGQLRVNVTTSQPAVSGERSWTVHTQDGTNVVATTLYTAAIDGADLAFDIYDELGNVTNGAFVQLYNGSQVLFVANNVFQDTDNNGLILIESGNVSSQQADTVQFNITRKGYVDRNQTTTRLGGSTTSYDPNSGNTGWNNGFRATGILFRIKITVTDELGNVIPDATVNVTNLPILIADGGMAEQSVTAANHTSNGVYYFALKDTFDNVSFQVTRAGFLDNNTFAALNASNETARTFLANGSAQITGDSTYQLRFKLKVTVQDELASGTVFGNGTGAVLFQVNNTVSTANRSQDNVYYFSIPESTGANVSVARSGYLNSSTNNVPVNSSNQSSITPQLSFTLKLTVVDELDIGGVFTNGVTIAINNTTSTANSTSANAYYFNFTPGMVNVSAAKAGYINSSNSTLNNVVLNATTQAAVLARLNFSIRVTDICNEIGGPSAADGIPGHCLPIAGLSGGTHANISNTNGGLYNTTYSGGDAYINATNGITPSSFRINASRDGFAMSSLVVRVNQSTQVRMVFNGTDQTGTATDRGAGLPFTIKVLGVFDELGLRNFTLNNTASWGQSPADNSAGAGVDAVGQNYNVFYVGPSAYVNATGTGNLELTAFLGNQSMSNASIGVTPNNVSQQTVIFNHTDQLSADVDAGGLKYVFNVTVGDELSRSTNFDTSVTVMFNDTVIAADKNANSGSGWSYYFTNTSFPATLNFTSKLSANATEIGVNRTGYINSTADNINFNTTNGTSRSFSLSFNLKVAVNDELSTAFQASAISFRANNSAVSQPNATNNVFAYFALPPQFGSPATTAGYLINASEVGYVDNATSDTALILVNSSTQALRNVTLLFTVKIPLRGICDEINVTCLVIDGSRDVIGSGGVEATGTGTGIGLTNSTVYSSNAAYINATNGTTISLTAFGDGYINRTVTIVTPNSNNQTFVVFNTSVGGDQTGVPFRHVNASALQFSVRVVSICGELNITCLTINGDLNAVQAAGVELNGKNSTDGNITRYSGGIAYIAVAGTGPGRTPAAVILNASGAGYVNATNSSVTPQVANQISVSFNGTTTPMRYGLKITLQDEIGGTTNMNTATPNINASVGVGVNGIENRTFFRTASSSNVYYLNVSRNNTYTITTNNNTIVNVSFSRDGYIFANQSGTLANATTQGAYTLSMPFSVRVNTGAVTGVTATVISGVNTFSAVDGNSSSDVNTTKDGVIYWALNQTRVTGSTSPVNVDLQVSKTNYLSFTFDDISMNYTQQLLVSPTMVRGNADDTTVPVLNLTSIAAGSNVTTTTPTFSFTIIDNDGGSGIDTATIAANISGFNFTRDCTVHNTLNISCSYTSSALTDGANHTIGVTVQDNAGNNATAIARRFGVDIRDGVTATLNTSDTSGVADNTYANGWSFTFNITLGGLSGNATDVNATAVKVSNWTRSGGSETIPTTGNTIMEYTISNGTAATYYVSHDYNTTDTIYPLKDEHLQSQQINGTVTVKVKLPTSTTPGTYTTTFTFGSWSVALSSGGNPT